MKFFSTHFLVVLALLISFSLTACSPKQPEVIQQMPPNQAGGRELITQIIEPDLLQPGLTVTYYLNYFKRNLNYLNQMKAGEFETIQGEPISQLNHQFGEGEVFKSGTAKGVAMRIEGYIYFPQQGRYELQALSNDGVTITIGNHLIVSDPRQHSDRLSDIARIHISADGWAPITVEYFQRKGTAALKLFWKTPAASKAFVPVPATSYGHRP